MGNQLFDQNAMTGVARTLMTSSNHPLTNQMPSKQNAIDADLLRNYYQNNAAKRQSLQDQSRVNSLDPGSLKSAATIESLLRGMNQNSLANQAMNTDSLSGGNLYNHVPVSSAAAVYHPAQQEVPTTNRLPPNFANLLASSHADDLLKSLEETIPLTSDQDSASFQGSANILDLLASLRSNTASSKRQSVTRYKNRNLTALLLQQIKKANLPRYQHLLRDRNTLPHSAFYESIHTNRRLENDTTVNTKKDRFVQERGESKQLLPSTKRNIVPVLELPLSNNTFCEGESGDDEGVCGGGDSNINR